MSEEQNVKKEDVNPQYKDVASDPEGSNRSSSSVAEKVKKFKNNPKNNRIVLIIFGLFMAVVFLVVWNIFSDPSEIKIKSSAGKSSNASAVQPAGDEEAQKILDKKQETEKPEDSADVIPPDLPQQPATFDNNNGGKEGVLLPDGRIVVKNSSSGSGVKVYSHHNGRYGYSENTMNFFQNYLEMFKAALSASPSVALPNMVNRQGNASSNNPQNNAGGNSFNPMQQEINDARYVSKEEAQRIAMQTIGADNATKNENYVQSNQTSLKIKDEYLQTTRRKPLVKLEIKAGTVINGVMVSGINSDLPGTIIGQVAENVYDTVTGHYLLIPQGSRMIGSYSSHVVYGQKRILAVWNRIIYPDGSSLNIGGLTGSDQAGYSGFKQKVNNHYSKLISAALFSSVFVYLGKEATKDDTDRYGRENKAAEAVMEQMASLGGKLAERNLNISPTLTIKPGYRFTIITTKDIAFTEDYIVRKR